MKVTKYIIAGMALTGILCLGSCAKKTTIESFYTYETECLGVALDGSQTLKVWGTGKDKKAAMKQAMKNAVKDILFNGIHTGSKDCGIRPLILEVNAQEKYEDYFNTFFQDGGLYSKYVSDETPKRTTKDKQYNQQQTKYGMVVRVQRAELKNRLEQDGIIKK